MTYITFCSLIKDWVIVSSSATCLVLCPKFNPPSPDVWFYNNSNIVCTTNQCRIVCQFQQHAYALRSNSCYLVLLTLLCNLAFIYSGDDRRQLNVKLFLYLRKPCRCVAQKNYSTINLCEAAQSLPKQVNNGFAIPC